MFIKESWQRKTKKKINLQPVLGTVSSSFINTCQKTSASQKKLSTLVLTSFRKRNSQKQKQKKKHSFVTTTLLLLGHCDGEWKLLTHMCWGRKHLRTSKLLPCEPTLQHRGERKKQIKNRKVDWKQTRQTFRTSVALGTRVSEKIKGLGWATFIPSHPSTHWTFQAHHMWIPPGAGRQYHFISSGTFLSLRLSPQTLRSPNVREGRCSRNSWVTVCAEWYRCLSVH